jgi:exopolysaccharide production protein ExoZ
MPHSFLGDAFNFGNFGVDIFFIVSGFIIFFSTASNFGRPSEVAGYLARRFSRIFPPYWLVLLGCILLELRFADADLSIARVLFSAVLVYGYQEPIVAVSWSLSYELIFYIAVACLLWARRNIALALLVAWACIATANHAIGLPARMWLSWWVVEFVLGCMFGWAASRGFLTCLAGSARPLFHACLGAITALGAWSATEVQKMDGASQAVLLAFAAIAIAAAGSVERTAGNQAPKLARLLGDAPYGIYLAHYPLLQLAYPLARRQPVSDLVAPDVFNLLLFVLLIAAGVAFHLVLEKPLVSWTSAALTRRRRDG